MTDERGRLAEARTQAAPWRKWGPYLSERQWGTVREDYGLSGDAWNYLSHDLARSVAYRWGEDGLAGISDDRQLLCFAVALWNGKDPILKERLFGLTNTEGNHGEDVKEYYFYLDSTPTHSYMRYLYKYPQAPFPYADLLETSRQRSRTDLEFELLDTGVFDEDRYFDVFVEYAKAGPEDLVIELQVFNRGPEAATLHLLPTLWYRNRWRRGAAERPQIRPVQAGRSALLATDVQGGNYVLRAHPAAELLFVDNDSNPARWRGPDVERPNGHPTGGVDTGYYKDGINDYLTAGAKQAVNPQQRGTKAAAHYVLDVPSHQHAVVRLRLTRVSDPAGIGDSADDDTALGGSFSTVLAARRREADEYYATVIPASLGEDRRNVMRQALAGMLWSKQFYDFDVNAWLAEHGDGAPSVDGRCGRNQDWSHMVGDDIISIPDKWEYPWCAAWDLAFQAIPLGLVDPDFAKYQLHLLLGDRYQHPNGQVPASEWNFDDVNPPVHAWAAFFLYGLDRRRTGKGDLTFLKGIYHKLLLNFTWWINRKDANGRGVFDGGFLGLDSIGVFDRNVKLPGGFHLEQADGIAWMAFYTQSMLQISLELALDDASYVDMAVKFFEQFVWISSAMIHIGGDGDMWDEEDGFFYDVLRTPDGEAQKLKVRSIVGLLPLCAATVFSEDTLEKLPELQRSTGWFVDRRPLLVSKMHDPRAVGYRGRRLLSLLSEQRLRRVLSRMLDENEFLSPYGIRSLSRHHLDHPFTFVAGGEEVKIGYTPAESDTSMFGGNANWRGPIWMPINGLLIRALVNYYCYYGPSFTVEYPTGSGRQMNLYEVARDLADRCARIFIRDKRGRRPVFGAASKFTGDPLWRDHLLFYEYFHGDNGAGIGASHQTGWTGLIATFLHYFASISATDALEIWTLPLKFKPDASTDVPALQR